MALIASYDDPEAWYPVYNGGQRGECFIMPASKYTLTSCKFNLQKAGSPTGNCYARLYAVTGTIGTDAVPTGSVLATSDAKDVSTISTSTGLVEFSFSGAEQYELQASTNYYIGIYFSASLFHPPAYLNHTFHSVVRLSSMLCVLHLA